MSDIKLDAKIDGTEAVTVATHGAIGGCSRIFNALFGRREVNIERHKMLAAAQTAKDVAGIMVGTHEYKDEIIRPLDSYAQTCSLAPYEIEEKRQESSNLANNLAIAVDICREMPENPNLDQNKPIDPDWFARWRREAKVIGTPELQNIWGRILAEKAVNESEISYRTLDIVKNITTFESNLFAKVLPFVHNLNQYICRLSRMTKYPAGIGITEASILVTAGLFQPLSAERFLNLKLCEQDFVELFFNDFVLKIDGKAKLYGIQLTQAGVELALVADSTLENASDAVKLCDLLKSDAKFNCKFASVSMIDKHNPE